MLFQIDNAPHFIVVSVTLLILTLVLLRRLETERRSILMGAIGFLVAIGGHYLATALEANQADALATEVHGMAGFVEGLALISLVATVLFRVLAPALHLPLPRILRDVSGAAGYIAWSMVWLQDQGVNVTGIIATSAVITAVVGLSMQDTLGNIVSGLALQLDDSLHVGDWIKLDDLYGQVVETRWRFTAVETHNWETVIIPNSVLMKNRFMVVGRRTGQPVQWRRWVYFNVDFRYTPSVVMDCVVSGVRSARIPNVAAQPLPNCVQLQVADSYARYAVRYWLTDLLATDGTDSEVLQHIYFALQRKGIPMSMPAAAVFLTQDTEERRTTKASHELQQKADTLRGVDVFKSMSDEEISHLAEQTYVAPFGPSEVITQQGATAHWLYILIDGSADITVENDQHHSVKVAEIGAGTCFGEWGLMTGEPRDATVTAKTRVVCYKLGKDAFADLIQRRPEIAKELSTILTERRVTREAALQSFDASTRDEHTHRTHSLVLQKLCHIFGVPL